MNKAISYNLSWSGTYILSPFMLAYFTWRKTILRAETFGITHGLYIARPQIQWLALLRCLRWSSKILNFNSAVVLYLSFEPSNLVIKYPWKLSHTSLITTREPPSPPNWNMFSKRWPWLSSQINNVNNFSGSFLVKTKLCLKAYSWLCIQN